jgi:hypothetical protein
VAAKPLRIAKALHQVSMWVHPEGLVKGAIYVTVGEDSRTQEDPRHVLNTEKPFLVLYRDQPEEVRFYNRSSIIRVEYEGKQPEDEKVTIITCRIHMMDGSVIDGKIIETLPSDSARLYDYLNMVQERFIRLYTSDGQICMVNKSYIIQVTT